MNRICSFLILAITLIICFSCNQHEKQETILHEAKRLISQNPDSTLHLLNSIRNPQQLNKNEFAEYTLLTLQAKDKTSQDISSDTLIFQVTTFYENANNSEKAALANYYSGRVYLAQRKEKYALASYLKAGTYADLTTDSDLKGVMQQNIGELNLHQFLYNEAIERFKKAAFYFSQNENSYTNKIASYNSLGNVFLRTGQRDSAFNYYDKGLKLVKLHNDSIQQTIITHNIGVMLKEIGDFNESKKYLQKALSFNRYLENAISYNQDEDKTAIIYLNLAQVFDRLNVKDSTQYYIRKTLEHLKSDEHSIHSIRVYRTLSQLEKENGNLDKALEFYQRYNTELITVINEKDTKSMMEIQKKYDYQLIKNTNNTLLIQRQWMLLGIAVLCLGLVVAAFIFYRKNTQSKIALFEANEKIEQLQELANNAVKEDNAFRNILVERFNIFKKAALLKEYLSEDERKSGYKLLKKFDDVLYGENNSFDWNILYQVMNELEFGTLDIIKEKFPSLTETEFRICCLTKAKLTNSEISLLMKSTVNAIQIRKTAIRKKLGIKEFGDIGDFLNQNKD